MKLSSLRALPILIVLISCVSIDAEAQYFTVGNDPVSIRWFQIKEPGFRLIFPEESEEQAIGMAGFLQDAIPSIGSSLKHTPARFPLILHSFSSTSNGFTIWAPSRIELFPRPPVIGGAESYADHLLIHEVRHMCQMDKLNQGFTHAASFLLGQQAVAAVIGLQMPGWFAEGDAVLSETLLSTSGRGRQALFHQGLRAIWLNPCDWSFDKALFGSYKHFVPNHYVLGYHLVSTARMLGGSDIWERALDRMGRKPYQVALLSRYLKDEIGLNKSQLYERARSWAETYWKNSLPQTMNPPSQVFVNQTDDYINYLKPIPVDAENYLLLKKSLASIPEFILLNPEGHEKHLVFPGYIEEAAYDYANNLLIWAENNPDIRWENQSFNNIYAYNLASGRDWQITRKSRFYSPVLSADARKIAAVEYLPDGTTQVAILETASGEKIASWKASEGETVQMPAWSQSGSVYFMSAGREGKKIYEFKLHEDAAYQIADLGIHEVFGLHVLDNRIYFIGPAGSTNGIFELVPASGATKLIAKDNYGINYLSSGNHQLFCSVYRLNGYKPALINTDQTAGELQLVAFNDPYLPLLSRSEKEYPIEPLSVTRSDFKIKRYRRFTHPFRFHSWAPVSLNTSNYGIKPGVMLLTQNDLGTLSGRAGAEYDYSFRRFVEFASISLPGWPIDTDIDFQTYADEASFNIAPNDTALSKTFYRNYQGSLRLNYPMDFSQGRWDKGFIAALMFGYNYYDLKGSQKIILTDRQYVHAGIGLKAYQLSRRAYRDLFPKWGYIFSLTAVNQFSMFEGDGETYLSGSIQLYLPGVLNNHSTRIYAGGHLQNGWRLPDQSDILWPRGMYRNFDRYNSSAKLDYAFPFWYPDWNLGSVLYIKRLKANIFGDFAKNLQDQHEFFASVGLDLTSDFNFLRIGLDFDGGIRMLYNVTDQKPGIQLLIDFSVN